MTTTGQTHSTQLQEQLWHPDQAHANEASPELRSTPRSDAGRVPDAAALETSAPFTSTAESQR